jgi:hypothetical protein
VRAVFQEGKLDEIRWRYTTVCINYKIWNINNDIRYIIYVITKNCVLVTVSRSLDRSLNSAALGPSRSAFVAHHPFYLTYTASKLAGISGWLTAGGTNAQMKEWYEEYKILKEELKAANAIQTTAPKT